MKIKRYTAVSMRAALALVRAEQGPDAVILSSRRNDDGIEVIAAIDYDEALFADANRQRAAAAASPTATAASPTATAASPTATAAAAAPRSTLVAASHDAGSHAAAPAGAMPAHSEARRQARGSLAPPSTLVRPDLGYIAMKREMQDMRQLLETGLAGMTWSDKRLREPLQARVIEELSAMDIAPDVALALAALTPRRTSLVDPSQIPLALLLRYLPVVDDLSTITGGIMAVVGPTGAGKTTTIAKLATRWCMRHGNRDLALISTDGYRIGAREQLMTHGRILGVSTHAANTGLELSRVLERLKSKKLVLIDTAGMGARDVRFTEQLATLQAGAARARVLLALPAQGEGHALEEICRAYARARPVACIITKVDEAASLGAVMSASLRHKLKIAYVCDGQEVPDDLHAAHRRRVWLVRTALKLKERRPPVRDEAYLARNFGRVPAHA